MKIRQGFVSNSSTTSFMICGLVFEESKINKILSETLGEYYSSWYKPGVAKLFKKLPDDIEVYHQDWGYPVYVGRSVSMMSDDETFGQFKERTKKDLAEGFGNDIELGIYSDGWFDG